MFNKLVNAIKQPFQKTRLNQVILFVTSKCNMRCRNCFYWRNLNKTSDLSFDELQQISSNLPQFNFLLISGGEPFLRENLVEIISLFRRNNKISAVGIPTNGYFMEKIITETEKIITENKRISTEGFSVYLYFSLDGLAPFHDSARGVVGTFEKCLESIKKANQLKKKYSNLEININTVISGENLDEIEKLINFVTSQGSNFVDGHYFELVRGSPKDPAVKNIDKEKLKKLYEKVILPYQEKIYQGRRRTRFLSRILAKFAVANLAYQYSCQYQNFVLGRAWDMPCMAGKSIVVIDSNGDLRLCELRLPISNLRKLNYDLQKFFVSKEAKEEIAKIKKEECSCTHCCFITESMYKSPKIVFWKLPIFFLRNLIK